MTVKVPGKLMVAGEFAVLEPYQKLVVMAVDRFVYATIEKGSVNTLTLESFNLTSITWHFHDGRVRLDTEDQRVSFVKEAMETTLTYLKEHHIEITPFSLTVRSELDDASGKKYGLGSSAAVVTSVVTAILTALLPIKPSRTLIFKLAAISHVKIQGNGSGADIAASTYGGVLEYASFQAEWLLKEIEAAHSVTALVEKKWTYYDIEPLAVPSPLDICIGWTGHPASTSNLVNDVLKLKQNQPEKFAKFIRNSDRAVHCFLEGMKTGNIDTVLRGAQQNRQALIEVGEDAEVDLETASLGVLCDLAEQYGGVGKPSGAGGGDCGMAFMPVSEHVQSLKKAWAENNIQPLDLHVYPYGARVVAES